MDKTSAKPKLVFFQFKYDERLPEFLLIHKREHAKCLSEFFDVTVVDRDCNYQQICDEHEPDLALFESGVNHETCQKIKIENTRCYPDVPKLGLHHGDGFCNARAGFLSDMDHWGIETFFAISVTAAEHLREFADNLFVWPVFVNPSVYHDYNADKTIPVLFTGNKNQFYPWRTKITKLVSNYYPSLICPHPGYGQSSTTSIQVPVGERYARMINASWFAPACGTVAKEVVRKHFEIPASRACLVAERSPGLEAAGFVDAVNCVFADEHDILDKLAYLFKNQEQLIKIIDAGYQLAHSRHRMEHRDQIIRWYELHKKLKSGQRIVQPNPFGPPVVVNQETGITSKHIVSEGLHLKLLRQGDLELLDGRYEEAERLYLRCANYMRWLPEVKFKLAVCNLYRGDAKKALCLIEEPIHFTLCVYNSIDPDPVEWAYLIVTLLCLGKLDVATKRATEFVWLHHPELDRVRWVTNSLLNGGDAQPLPKGSKSGLRRSIHQLPSRSLKAWVEQLCIMLQACGQHGMAQTLGRATLSDVRVREEGQCFGFSEEAENNPVANLDTVSVSETALTYVRRRMFYRRERSRIRSYLADALHFFERKHRYFLPYRWSESRNDEFYGAIRSLAREEVIKTALLIGSNPGEAGTEAFFAGVSDNLNCKSIFCIGSSEPLFHGDRKWLRDSPVVHWYEIPLSGGIQCCRKLENAVTKLMAENRIEYFDFVFFGGSDLDEQLPIHGRVDSELHKAKYVLLDNLKRYYIRKNYESLLRDPNYFISACNPDLRNGYAIFRRHGREDVEKHMLYGERIITIDHERTKRPLNPRVVPGQGWGKVKETLKLVYRRRINSMHSATAAARPGQGDVDVEIM